MWILIASIFLALFLLVSAIAAFTFFRYRGARFVECPENKKTEVVRVSSGEAALSAAIGNPHLRLAECTRWPEMKDCAQECLKQIEYAPEDCLVRNVVAHWYADKRCAVCGHQFGVVHWHDHAPALVDDQGQTVQWSDVPLARLMEFLETHKAVCWNCHIVESFRHQHPELITHRKER
jgi:hypothetical protein